MSIPKNDTDSFVSAASFWVHNTDNLIDFAYFFRHLSHRLWFILGKGGFQFAVAPISAAIAFSRAVLSWYDFQKSQAGMLAVDFIINSMAAVVFIVATGLLYGIAHAAANTLAVFGVALYSVNELLHFFNHVYEAMTAKTAIERQQARSRSFGSLVSIVFGICCCAVFAKLSFFVSLIVSAVAVIISAAYLLSRVVTQFVKVTLSSNAKLHVTQKNKPYFAANKGILFKPFVKEGACKMLDHLPTHTRSR